MGNECCSGRRTLVANFREFPEGEALKEAIITRNDSLLLDILMKTASKDLLRCSMDDDCNSPFLLACIYSFDRLETLMALLRAGANPRAKNRFGNTAIHMVCSYASPTRSALAAVKLLHVNFGVLLETRNINGLDALWPAVARGDLNAYKYLKSFGGDLEAVNHSNENLIFPAIRSGNYELVKFMLEKDHVRLDKVNKSGETPLHIAARCSSLIYSYLSKTQQIDLSVKDNSGHTCSELVTEIKD